jgi:uroporphyrinogen III methyltransferase/synthase
MIGERGFVSLVGAGPGDAELITVGGVARLAQAEVVIYDRLANPTLLRHAADGAELIYAGKEPDRHALSQEDINALLVAKAREGKRVVRLKGGDPFVFGRGGEEAEALVAAGVPFDVLPGVTSAVAAPAYAGIPVTHRGLASSFAVVTGHEDPEKDESAVDWAKVAPGADTLVLLMGVGRLDEIARRVIDAGRDAETPVAVVEWGTLPRQRCVTATLATVAEAVRDAGIGAPAVTVIGEVVSLRDDLRWYDNRALTGTRVLVTRTRQQASELSRLLAAAGAEPIELPTLQIVRRVDAQALAAAIDALRTGAYQWSIFTSVNGVDEFMSHLQDAGLDARAFGRSRLAAIGAGTAGALERHGLRADVVPERYVAEGLLDAFEGRVVRGQRVLLPRAEDARPQLIDGLVARDARVDELTLYSAEVPRDPQDTGLQQLRAGDVDVVTFASSSAVRNLVRMLGGDVSPLRAARIAVIGPITARAVRDAGLDAAVIAEQHTVEGLVEALVNSERAPIRGKVAG